MEARRRFFSSAAELLKVSVFVVLVEEIVEAVVVVVVVDLGGRPRGDFFCPGDVFVDSLDSLVSFSAGIAVFFFAGLFGGFSERLADFGRPRGRAAEVFGDGFSSSTMGEGLRFRPGDLRVPRRVLATSWLLARVVRLLSIVG